MHRRQCQARRRLKDPKVAATLAWAGMAITAKGWVAEVWTGCDPLLLTNVRFLAGYRRSWLFDPAQIHAAEAAIIEGDTIGCLEGRLRDSASTNLGRSCSTCFGRDAPALS